MDCTLLRRLQQSGIHFEVYQLHQVKEFGMAATNIDEKRHEILCKMSATVSICLQIRHGTALNLKNVRWMTMDQAGGENLFPSL